MREDRDYYERDYYNRKSLEDSMRYCVYCIVCLIGMLVGLGVYNLFKYLVL